MTANSITSFVVRCQHTSGHEQIKVKLTHVQGDEDLYFDQLEDAFEKIQEIVSGSGSKKR